MQPAATRNALRGLIGAHANAVRDELAQLAVEFGQLARSVGVPTPTMDEVTRNTDISVSPLRAGSTTLTHQSNRRRRRLHDFGQYAARTRQVLMCRFGKREADDIVAETRSEFERLIPVTPYIGGRANPLTWNLESSAIFLALFRVLRRRELSMEEIGEIAHETVERWLRAYPA